ncbi:hypothetical protein ABT150_04185 [Streptomyces mirabilis]|uniref:hypothetical protein n=1 Tax=Streptomyces mirabilis TaxID=68239 RepID=UPI00331B70FA
MSGVAGPGALLQFLGGGLGFDPGRSEGELLHFRCQIDLGEADDEVALHLPQAHLDEVEPGHEGGVGDRLEMYVPVGCSPFQLDHHEAAGGVQAKDVQSVPCRHSVRVGPPVELRCDHEYRLTEDLRVGDHPLL